MSNPEPRAAAKPFSPRRVPLLGWLGLLALAASATVAALAPGWSRAEKPGAAAPAPGPAAAAKPASRAVCFGYVDVEQGVTSLYPVQSGRVAEVLTREGAAVEKGAPLFRLDDALPKLRVREAKAALAAAEARLEQARALPEQHQKKIEALKAAIDAARQEAEAARARRDKVRRLEKNIGGSDEDLRAAEALVGQAEGGARARQAELAGLEAVDPQTGVKLAEQDVAARRADLEQAELALKECTVIAPAKGTVLRLNVSPGEVLGTAPRLPALLFCPDAPRVVRAEVEQEFAGGITVGQPATIQDDATATGHWTGKVTRVSDWYTHRRSVLMEPLQYNDVRTLECIIEVAPGQAPLRIGQRVRVTLGSVEP
jgi:multidrug resistance efflux pump